MILFLSIVGLLLPEVAEVVVMLAQVVFSMDTLED
jgi:hypothetical protein